MGYGFHHTAAVGHTAWVVRETSRTAYRAGGFDLPTFDDAEIEELDGIESEVAVLAAHIHAAMQPFLALIARYDRKRGWVRGGHKSCAHWLSYLTSFDLGTCREYVRVARALEELPETSAAMSRGALSFSKARALTRVAKPETEGDLLELAEGVTVAVLERMVRAWRLSDRLDEAERERRLRESRGYSIFPGDDGLAEVRGHVTNDVAAMMKRTIEAASDHLYRERKLGPVPPEIAAREAAKLRADAVELIYLRAAQAGFGPEDPKTLSGTRAERYQVMLHVTLDALKEDPEGSGTDEDAGMCELEDGTRISYETGRRICCDAGVVRVTKGADGSVLDVGRKTRKIPPALRRALEVRDRGCRFPGCGLRFTDGHHVHHWIDGGETSLRNTVLLCGYHHSLVHEGGWKVEWWGPDRRRAAFRDPRGQVHVGRPPKSPELGEDPVGALVERNGRDGADPDPWTAGARWKFERDIPDEVYFCATEAAL